MRRIVLGGDGLADYEPTEFADQYVNAFFYPPDVDGPVPFDLDATKGLPVAERPLGRRYTIRSWDPATREVTIDFVVHGDVGRAGRWAGRAEVGDRLQFAGPHGAYSPAAGADWYLLIGDESALPAIAAALDQLAADATAVVVIAVDSPEHEVALAGPVDAAIHWIHRRADPGNPDQLLEAVTDTPFPSGTPDVFVHGEAAEVRAIRRHLIADRGIAREGTSISPYWRRNFDDEAWRAVKREWLEQAAADV